MNDLYFYTVSELRILRDQLRDRSDEIDAEINARLEDATQYAHESKFMENEEA